MALSELKGLGKARIETLQKAGEDDQTTMGGSPLPTGLAGPSRKNTKDKYGLESGQGSWLMFARGDSF